MRVWVAIPLAVAVLAGCVGLEEPVCRSDPAGLHTPWVDESFLHTDPLQSWDTVVLQHGGEEAELSVHPDSWRLETERLSPLEPVAPVPPVAAPAPFPSPSPVPSLEAGSSGSSGSDGSDGRGGPKLREETADLSGRPGNFSIVRVTPSTSSSAGMDHGGQLRLGYDLGGCEERKAGTITWDLSTPKAGASAQPGQGVQVYTAGFWENGTLFYTNIEAVDHGDWPRAGWYLWEGGEPLPVYVYDEDRSEEPAYWRPLSSNAPATGTPADPVIHEETSEVDRTTGLGYFTTIPGFNEALKGLSTSTVRVVRLAPEEAYTRPGNEEHPLYGDAIVFYIKVVHVVDLPCPMLLSGRCSTMATPSPFGAGGAAWPLP